MNHGRDDVWHGAGGGAGADDFGASQFGAGCRSSRGRWPVARPGGGSTDDFGASQFDQAAGAAPRVAQQGGR
jgi:hypothetical protein